MANEKPTVVKIHDVKIDREYVQWLEEVKARYRSAQIKAAVNVNAEKLRFNWELGRNLLKVVFVCLVKCVQFLAVDVKDCRNPAAFQQGTTISLRLSAEQAMWPGNRPTSGAEAQGISLPLSCSLSISEVNIFKFRK